jgi:predicted nucleic acid-binding protein
VLLVLDASVAVAASHNELGFARFRTHELIAPPLMRVEAGSVLHELAWRGQLSTQHARAMLGRVLNASVEVRDPPGLTEAAWRLADELGWAKTYDAHYVALAQLAGCKLVTLDERLQRGLARFGIAVRPSEL